MTWGSDNKSSQLSPHNMIGSQRASSGPASTSGTTNTNAQRVELDNIMRAA